MRCVRTSFLVLATVLAPFVLAGCGSDAAGDAGTGRLQVVTTVAPITSIVASVAGGRADITGLVPEGTNSHTFDPPPSAAAVLSEADLVFINGLKLEEPTRALAEAAMSEDAVLVEIGTEVLPESEYIYDFSFPEEEGKPNPHLWTDPTWAIRYAAVVRDSLTEADPDGAAHYQAGYEAFEAQATELSDALEADQESIPQGQKQLLTYHDAYAYFARDYGWDVIGAIQVSDFEDPTPKEVAGLIGQVRKEKVPAIFGSEVFPSPVLKQIGKETGVKYVDVLRDDDLPGEPGSAEHSWMGLMHFDYVTMTEALGGDAAALVAFTPKNVAPDKANYPQ